jgi:hypothetical protein
MAAIKTIAQAIKGNDGQAARCRFVFTGRSIGAALIVSFEKSPAP